MMRAALLGLLFSKHHTNESSIATEVKTDLATLRVGPPCQTLSMCVQSGQASQHLMLPCQAAAVTHEKIPLTL